MVGNAVGRIAPDGTVKEFKIRTPNSRPIMIVEEPEHKSMWFTEEAGNKVGRIKPDGSITEFPVPKSQDNVILAGLAFDGGGNLWVQQYVDVNQPCTSSIDHLVKIDPCACGIDHLVKIDQKIRDSNSSDIDKISFEFYKVPTCQTVMHRIDLVPDQNLWSTELKTDKVGLLSLTEDKSAGSP